MSILTGKEALIALANGEEVEVSHPHDKWYEGWQLNDFGYWRTEEEIRQVVAALRSIFK